MGQRLEMGLLLRLGLLLELRQHVQVSVVLFADMDICSPFAVLVSCSFGRFGSPLFFWQLLVSYEALGRSILSVFIVSGVG